MAFKNNKRDANFSAKTPKLQFDLLLEKKTVSSEPAATPHL